jgi:LuxR family maltose regulon positive regulatory protein
LSLDQGDNDAGRFWLYVAAALQKEIPEIKDEIIPIFASLTHPPTETILTVLLNMLAEAGRDVTLLLDDYHVISRQEIHDGLAFFLEHLPTTMHMVIASRTDPPLPLVRLRAGGQLLELHANDLRFSSGAFG